MTKENAKEEEKPKEEFVYKPIKKKQKISSENAVNAVSKIMDIIGAEEFSSGQVEQIASLIESGRLSVKNDDICYTLSKGIKLHGDKVQNVFVIREPNDTQLEGAGIDIFAYGQQMAQGKDIGKKIVKGLTYLTLGIDESFAFQIPTRDMMTIFALYNLFFIGQ